MVDHQGGSSGGHLFGVGTSQEVLVEDTLFLLSERIACNAISKGFKAPGEKREPLLTHMLIVTEVAELSEAHRVEDQPSEHIPNFTAREEEAADILIRTLDICHEQGFRIGAALLSKMAYNESRPHKHGKRI